MQTQGQDVRLCLVEERRAKHAVKLEVLRAAMQVGFNSIERGEGTCFDSPQVLWRVS